LLRLLLNKHFKLKTKIYSQRLRQDRGAIVNTVVASTCASTSECRTPVWAAVAVSSETMGLAGIVLSPEMGHGRLRRV